MAIVYLLRRPNGQPFYVGVGANEYRPRRHLAPTEWEPYDPEYPSSNGQVRLLMEAGTPPTIDIIHEDPSREVCEEFEEFIISELGRVVDGGILYNKSQFRGGRVRGQSYPMREETLLKYRETCRANRKYKIERDELYDLYITQGMTRRDVAKHYGCSDVTIKARLREYGITKQH